MIVKDKHNRCFDNSNATSFGVFVRKVGGYYHYNNWLQNQINSTQQKRNEQCNCDSGLKYKKCCINKHRG
jgi:uncharacterized protein YchJ